MTHPKAPPCRRDHQNSAARLCQFCDCLIDFLSSSRDPASRFIEYHDFGLQRHPFSENDLLLIAATEVPTPVRN